MCNFAAVLKDDEVFFHSVRTMDSVRRNRHIAARLDIAYVFAFDTECGEWLAD